MKSKFGKFAIDACGGTVQSKDLIVTNLNLIQLLMVLFTLLISMDFYNSIFDSTQQ